MPAGRGGPRRNCPLAADSAWSPGTVTRGCGQGLAVLTRPRRAPLVFVLEYYLDSLWKGMLLFVVCLLLLSFGLVSQVGAPGPVPLGSTSPGGQIHCSYSAPRPEPIHQVPTVPAGAESGDVGLPCVRHGRRPVDHDLIAAAAPPGVGPHVRRVPFLHPGPHRVSGPHPPGLRAPGAQLRR